MVVHRTPVPGAYRFVAVVMRPLLRLITRYEVTGSEHIPASGGFIVTPNHISYSDPFPWAHTLYNMGIAPVFLAKSELFATRVIGTVLRKAGQVPVHRESPDAVTALRSAVAAIDAGHCVVVYPEGSLTRDPDLWPMRGKSGAARLAIEAGCPVIPVAQWGPQDLLPRYAKVPRLRGRTTIHIRFGPPVDLADLPADPHDREVVAVATARVMAGITRELEHLRGEQAPPTRYDPAAHGQPATGNYRRAQRHRSTGGTS